MVAEDFQHIGIRSHAVSKGAFIVILNLLDSDVIADTEECADEDSNGDLRFLSIRT